MSNFYCFTDLIGGGAGALDSRDGADLSDGDAALVVIDGTTYTYRLDATSGASEDSPNVISPDSNPGSKRWILQSMAGVQGSTGGHFATREYVDLALGAFKSFFISDTASGVGALNYAYPQETGEGQSTIVTSGLGSGPAQLVKGFITEAGEPNSTTIHSGVIEVHFHAKKGASNHRITELYAVLSSVDANGTSGKTTIAISEVTPELTDTETDYHIHVAISDDVEIADTARLILDVYANVTTGAVDAVITLYMEGTEDSYFTMPIDSRLWQEQSDRLDDLSTTDATAAELNELTDSSETTLHSHAGGAGTGFGRPLVFVSQMNEPPTANFATLDLRNNHPVLDFALNEIAVFSGVMPQGYEDGGLTVYLHYAMTSAVADDIKLEAYLERIGDQQQDIDADGFASAQNSGDITVPGTSGFVDVITIAFTSGAQMDSIAAGESFRIKIKRIAVAGTDASGDLELTRTEIKET